MGMSKLVILVAAAVAGVFVYRKVTANKGGSYDPTSN